MDPFPWTVAAPATIGTTSAATTTTQVRTARIAGCRSRRSQDEVDVQTRVPGAAHHRAKEHGFEAVAVVGRVMGEMPVRLAEGWQDCRISSPRASFSSVRVARWLCGRVHALRSCAHRSGSARVAAGQHRRLDERHRSSNSRHHRCAEPWARQANDCWHHPTSSASGGGPPLAAARQARWQQSRPQP